MIKSFLKISPLLATIALVACNSGSSWVPGTLGTLSIAITPTPIVQISQPGTTTVTATLTGAQAGTDPIGSATITFGIINESSITTSNIASLNSTSCTIANPVSSSTVSCSVALNGIESGNARIIASANAGNTNGIQNQNGYATESFIVVP